MSLRNTENSYGLAAKALHWGVALLIFSLLAIGWYMGDLPRGLEKFRYVELHKSLGLTVLLLMVARVLWRAFNPPPPLPADLPGWEQYLAKLAHWAIYAAIFLQVAIGMGLVWTANSPLTFFGLFVLPSPLAPDHDLHELGETLHELLARVIALLLLLHIGAALRHHFILKNNILRRMLMIAMMIGVVSISGQARAGTWNILPSSQLLFHFKQSGASFSGRFERFDARIEFDEKNPENGRIDVMIDVASLDTQNAERDGMLRSEELFDTVKYPQAEFKADKIRVTAPDKYEAEGILTIRDISLPVMLPFSLQITAAPDDGDVLAAATGITAISRRDFGLARGQWDSMDIVADEVQIEIKIDATRQP